MRRTALLALVFLAAPAALAAQDQTQTSAYREQLALRILSETRRLDLLPNESVGFRIVGATAAARSLRITTGHLAQGHLYQALFRIVPRDGGNPLRIEGTVSADAPSIAIGALPAGEYVISMHLEDLSSGDTRDAQNKVVLRS